MRGLGPGEELAETSMSDSSCSCALSSALPSSSPAPPGAAFAVCSPQKEVRRTVCFSVRWVELATFRQSLQNGLHFLQHMPLWMPCQIYLRPEVPDK